MAESQTPDEVVLRRTRELFLLQPGRNASVLTALKEATRELRCEEDERELWKILRNSTRESDGEQWRIKMLDRAIEEAARAK